MPRLLALALCLLVGAASAAEVLPSAGKAVGFVRDDTPGFWLVLSSDLSPVDAKFYEGDDKAGFKVCVFEGAAGRYMAIKIEQGRPKPFAVVLDGVSPTPFPPPGPGPKPPPNPPPPPQPTTGPLRVIILEETADRSKYSKDVTGVYLSSAVASYLRTHTHDQ